MSRLNFSGISRRGFPPSYNAERQKEVNGMKRPDIFLVSAKSDKSELEDKVKCTNLAYDSLKDKTTGYAEEIKALRDYNIAMLEVCVKSIEAYVEIAA